MNTLVVLFLLFGSPQSQSKLPGLVLGASTSGSTLALAPLQPPPPAEATAEPSGPSRFGELSVAMRYRLEFVDDESVIATTPSGTLEEALASTLRTQLRLDSHDWKGVSLHIAVENVTTVGGDTYNNAGAGSLNNGRPDRAVVADPESTEISQAFVALQPNDRASLSAGRQELSFDQQRFIGSVGWRQNHQEFDALQLALVPIDGLTVKLAYLDRVYTVTGADQAMGSSLLDFQFALDHMKIGGYGYWLDYDSAAQAKLSSATVGIRSSGTFAGGAASVELEIAEQRDNGNHPDDFALAYRSLKLGWNFTGDRGPRVIVGGELLEGNGTNSFRTPLATLHKFNGFADRFLVTPATGLEDLFATVSWNRDAWSGLLTYHRFDPEYGSGASYGDEWDTVLSYQRTDSVQFAMKTAFYRADSFSNDSTKVMFWTAWSF